jgi:hypothetical protein
MLARIDAFAQARCLGRAEAVRALLCNGFEASLPWVAAGGSEGDGASESAARSADADASVLRTEAA